MVDLRNPSSNTPRISGAGTSEMQWRQCPRLNDLDGLSLDFHEVAIVVAPHPDDETLALGGTIAAMAASGMAVVVVTASDGEASHPSSPTVTPDEMSARRRGESERALRALAHGQAGNVLNVQLHLGDGRLGDEQDQLTEQLVKFLRPEDICFATWEFDGHPDHEAVGRAARRACAITGARLLGYPVWMWHWASPDEPTLPWQRARRIELSDSDQSRKRDAIACFESQIRPLSSAPGDEAIVAPPDLEHFQRPYEVVFE